LECPRGLVRHFPGHVILILWSHFGDQQNFDSTISILYRILLLADSDRQPEQERELRAVHLSR
jgi:hypothetical protein